MRGIGAARPSSLSAGQPRYGPAGAGDRQALEGTRRSVADEATKGVHRTSVGSPVALPQGLPRQSPPPRRFEPNIPFPGQAELSTDIPRAVAATSLPVQEGASQRVQMDEQKRSPPLLSSSHPHLTAALQPSSPSIAWHPYSHVPFRRANKQLSLYIQDGRIL